MTRVLLVLSGSPTWTLSDGSAHSGGYWSPEMTYPYRIFSDEGFEVSIATPGGAPAFLDPESLRVDYNGGDEESVRFQKQLIADIGPSLEAPLVLEDVDPDDFDVIYVSGGFGVFQDVVSSPALGALIAAIQADRSKVVATVCAGGSALLGAFDHNGRWLFLGRQVTGFTNAEKRDFGVIDTAPFLLESRLGEEGAVFQQAEAHGEKVVVDGNLITGQNAASTVAHARAVVDYIREGAR